MRPQSKDTELRNLRREVKDLQESQRKHRFEVEQSRGQRTKALQEAAEWKARFDALLARVPVAGLKEAE